MDLITLILGIALIGLAVWAITTYIPMPAPFKTAISIIAIVVIILFLLRTFAGSIPNIL